MNSKKMMRTVGRWFGMTFMAACIGLAGVGCTGNGNTEGQQQLAAGDSACYVLDEQNLLCKIYAEEPEERLRLAVGEWMDELLGGCYPGDATDIRALVDFYGKALTDTLRHELKELPEGVIVEYEFRMGKVYETDKIVSYSVMRYLNLGGAHPSTAQMGATFRKSDGRRLSWDIIRRPLEYQFNELLKKHLYTYFGVETDEELEKMLMGVDNIYDIPLPYTPPYFMENGVCFIYQQYEIGAYAMGMPNDTIPYESIQPFLTEWAKRLVVP
ncbi:MAG: DUF3298 domain-containing protein [Prevotella sp.]|nr:DUF3298 domain-containing protein [Prevotella sp.]